jgi:elongation factor Tu
VNVIAERCPNCGAPLRIEQGHCAFCHVPLEVGGTITVPTSAPGAAPDLATGEFAFTVEDVFHIKGRGTVATGVVTGSPIGVGQAVVVTTPDGHLTLSVSGLETFRRQIESAAPGTNVGILLRGVGAETIKPGAIMRIA